MPVTDGVFEPRTPLTPAEQHVDWASHDAHILSRRRIVEQHAAAATRRLANATHLLNGSPHSHVSDVARHLEQGLAATARYGYRQAQIELYDLRSGRPAHAAVTRPVPDAGLFATIAASGLSGVLQFVRNRAGQAAASVASQISEVLLTETDPVRRIVAARDRGRRALHNNVLDLVGETLNLGRAAGALKMRQPPTFALRSEQLDKNTCAPCDGLHGTIVVVGSPEFYALMPPAGCLGGGRCRGIWVFGDNAPDVRAPALQAA